MKICFEHDVVFIWRKKNRQNNPQSRHKSLTLLIPCMLRSHIKFQVAEKHPPLPNCNYIRSLSYKNKYK